LCKNPMSQRCPSIFLDFLRRVCGYSCRVLHLPKAAGAILCKNPMSQRCPSIFLDFLRRLCGYSCGVLHLLKAAGAILCKNPMSQRCPSPCPRGFFALIPFGLVNLSLTSRVALKREHQLFLFTKQTNSLSNNQNHHAMDAKLGLGRGLGHRWDIGFLHNIAPAAFGRCKTPQL